jgi:threonine dehydrogenase-like Zn-dependent dehydrogenase
MMVATLKGAEVLVVDLVDDRLDQASALGAQLTARADSPDLAELVANWTSGLGVDLSVEAVGGQQNSTLEMAQRLTTRRGRIVVMGSFSEKLVPFPVGSLKYLEQELIGSSGHPRTFGPVIELVASGALKVAKLISHTIDLEGLQGAFDMMDKRVDGVMKVVVEPNR